MAEPRAPKRRRQAFPAMCLDEHISPQVAKEFKSIFRVTEASHNPKYKGRDEWGYINELYEANALFVTSDYEHASKFRTRRFQHAGVIYVPSHFEESEKVLYAQIVIGFVQGYCNKSRFALRNHMVYPAAEGFHIVHAGRDRLHFSWAKLGQLIDDHPTGLARRTRKSRKK